MTSEWEIHYRRTGGDDDAPWTVAPRVAIDEADLTVAGLEHGAEYEIRARIIDGRGRACDWVYWTHEVKLDPRDVPSVEGLAITDEDCLSWRMPLQRERIAGFRVRHAPGDSRRWGPAEPAHEGLVGEPPFLLCGIPGGQRTFLVRAVDVDGNEGSVTAIVATPKPLAAPEANVLVEDDHQALGFPGTIVGGSVSGGALVATVEPVARYWKKGIADAVRFWDGTTGAKFWNGGTFWRPRAGGAALHWSAEAGSTYWGSRYRAMTYEATKTVKLKDGGPAAVLTLDVDASVGGWRVEYRRQRTAFWSAPEPGKTFWGRPSTPRFWTVNDAPWLPWPGRLERVPPGLFEFRVVLPAARTPARLEGFDVAVSAPDREERFVALMISPNGTRLPISAPYRTVTRVKDLAVRTDGSAVQVLVEDLDPIAGPMLRTIDKDDAFVAGVVDATVVGC